MTFTHVSPEEYLARERAAETKSEYLDGKVVAMEGSSERHNLIVASIITAIGPRLRGSRCRVYPSDLKVRAGTRYFYPDVSVICGATRFDEGQNDVVTNPSVLIEVLSDGTAGYDRGPKFLSYQQIETLRDYVLVDQHELLIEHYRRQGEDSWLYTRHRGPEGRLELASPSLSFTLAELYPETETATD